MLCLRPRTDGFSDPQEILKDLWLLPIPFFFFFFKSSYIFKAVALKFKVASFYLNFLK